MKKIFSILLISILIAAPVKTSAFLMIEPPLQPSSGPGGKDYGYNQIISYLFKEDNKEYWIFEPGDSQRTSLPVIVFCHGWGAGNPVNYSAWINHLVRKGSIVIFPKFQKNIFDYPGNFSKSAFDIFSSAYENLANNGSKFYSKPDFSKLAIAGHSAGGAVAANLAVLLLKSPLPDPKALMCIAPATAPDSRFISGIIELEDLSALKNMEILAAIGDKDNLAPSSDAEKIISESSEISISNKNLILLRSDSQNRKSLIADHLIACGASSDALDYFGLWKLFDGLRDSAFYGKNVQYALGDTSQQRFMGYWSNGVPVKELEVVKMADSAIQPSSQEEPSTSSLIFRKSLFGKFLSNFNKWKK